VIRKRERTGQLINLFSPKVDEQWKFLALISYWFNKFCTNINSIINLIFILLLKFKTKYYTNIDKTSAEFQGDLLFIKILYVPFHHHSVVASTIQQRTL
jgi:hypothetical protein